MRKTFIDMLCKYAEVNPNVILLTGDLGTNCLEKFQQKFPDRFIDCGIAEQNMLGVASGLALSGKKVFVYSICNFVAERGLEFIRDLICYHNLDVNIIGVGAGLEYGSLGYTHHAVDDVGAVRSIANLDVICPANASECEKAMNFMFENNTPCYLRLNKKSEDIISSFACKKLNGITECYAGKRFAILASGAILAEAVRAGQMLAKLGEEVGVYSVPLLKPINAKIVEMLANHYELLITLEEHSIIGGLGSAVCEIVAERGVKATVARFGILDEVTSVVGKQGELRHTYKIDADSIVHFIKGKIK